MNFDKNKIELESQGYSITSEIYNEAEVAEIIKTIKLTETNNKSFLKTKGLFAIRQLMNHAPNLLEHICNDKFLNLLSEIGGDDYFLTKAIYFDKPEESNWFVAYHQDLSISVKEKSQVDNYENWTFKKGQYGVQPPMDILENIITFRIHLDDTNEENGALKVIPESHTKKVYRPSTINWDEEKEVICNTNKGQVMLMKPLTLHASSRTTNNKQRRVIHLEFCNKELANPLEWIERKEILFN
jgi:ectoine hydroxylase-related dioxygenase (phytanoyl-CoA dioxygenase family)